MAKRIYQIGLLVMVMCLGFFQPNANAKFLWDEIDDLFWDCYHAKVLDIGPFDAYGECKGKSYKPMFEKSNLSEKLEDHVWIPAKGSLKVLSDCIELKFEFDSEAIDFFKSKFAQYQNRMPIALEIDIYDLGQTMDSLREAVVCENTEGQFPNIQVVVDTKAFDSGNNYSLIVKYPQNFKAGVLYTIRFYPNGTTQNTSQLRLSFQIGINISVANKLAIAYDDNYRVTSSISDSAGTVWDYFVVESDGFSIITCPYVDKICWHDKNSDKPGCEDGDPFAQSSPGSSNSGSNIPADNSDSPPNYANPYASPVTNDPPIITTPKPLPNLRPYEMKVYRGDTLLVSGRNQSQAGESFKLESYIVSDNADCINGGNPRNIDSEVQVQIGDGSWITIDTVQTQPSTLTKGNPHKETTLYLIPEVARGKMLRFRIKVDSENEIKETNENDNVSDPANERYPIVGSYNLAVANASLTNGNAQVYQNSIGRVRYAITNTGPDTPLSSQGIRTVSEVKKPGSSTFVLIDEDGSDSDELSPNRLQEESTSLDGFSFNLPGIWTFRIRTDCYNKLIETNESDNEFVFTINVVPDNRRASVIITGLGLKEGKSFKKNTRVHPWVKVKNTGDAFPAGAITIDYLIDGKRRDGDTIQASELGPGVEKEEKVNNNDIRLGDKGNRTLTVVVKINGAEVARKNFSFKVK